MVKVGDLVICHCSANVWWKGLIGTLVEIDWLGDAHVLYSNGKIKRLVKSGLEVVS